MAVGRGQVPDAFLASLSVPDRIRRWQTWFEDPNGSRIRVAVAEGRVVGFVSAGPSRDEHAEPGTGEVYAIYIDQDRLGTWLWHRLLDTATAWLRASHFSRATLWVLDSNDRARRSTRGPGGSRMVRRRLRTASRSPSMFDIGRSSLRRPVERVS